MHRPTLFFVLTLLGALASVATQAAFGQGTTLARFTNAHVVAEDRGERVPPSYFLRRAWVQITRDLAATEVPPTLPLDIEAMAQRPFAVAWLGHAAMLLRAGSKWVLLDPALSDTAGPVQGFGPARLTPLPIALQRLPHIDLVLISHDHYDHLDLGTMRHLARQPGGPPRVFAGRGSAAWIADHVAVRAEEFDWWQSRDVDGLRLRFVPAQHHSGRTLSDRNQRLWGGWVVEHGGQRFHFAGDTAYVRELFRDIRQRVGPIDLAAIPIGAYLPRPLMRHEHLDPADAVMAFLDLGAKQAFGVHWGTFQLGDEEPFDAARDLAASLTHCGATGFGLLPVGGFIDVVGHGPDLALLAPAAMVPARADEAVGAAAARAVKHGATAAATPTRPAAAPAPATAAAWPDRGARPASRTAGC
jgi:L-ascorbate metabolism protein UlaG (beta-lactamase superfamily)